MADLIDRQAALDALDTIHYTDREDWWAVLSTVENLPTVQPNHNADVSKMVDDLISRQAAIDAIHCNITVTGRQNAELVAATIGAFADRIKALPPVQVEPLTDREQRIFLAAMSREKEVCKEVDYQFSDVREPYEDTLVSVCKEIERKVKAALWMN